MNGPPWHGQALVYVRQLADEAGLDPDITLVSAVLYADLTGRTLLDSARLLIERDTEVTP